MARWKDALRSYRRLSVEEGPSSEPRPVMFVLCSESQAVAALVAACEPALVLQTLGGARDPADAGTRATFEYAIVKRGVRQVVVCGHEGCSAPQSDSRTSQHPSQAVVSQCVDLRNDPQIGSLRREYHVTLQPVWFDVAEGDVFRCDFESDRLAFMGDEDVARTFRLPSISSPATPSEPHANSRSA